MTITNDFFKGEEKHYITIYVLCKLLDPAQTTLEELLRQAEALGAIPEISASEKTGAELARAGEELKQAEEGFQRALAEFKKAQAAFEEADNATDMDEMQITETKTELIRAEARAKAERRHMYLKQVQVCPDTIGPMVRICQATFFSSSSRQVY